MWPFKRKKEPPNILDEYLSLAEQGRFKEGLPLIREIVDRGPQISTSWFNLGVCEAELGWHARAAQSFLQAYELDPNDGGALYRACVSLSIADDRPTLLRILQRECQWNSEIIELWLADEYLSPLFDFPEFRKLKDRYGGSQMA